MKKTIKYIVGIFLLFPLITGFANAEEQKGQSTIVVPFVFEHKISIVYDDLIQVYDDDHGIYNFEGKRLSNIPFEKNSRTIENGYITIYFDDILKSAVYRKDGTRVFEQSYANIIVTNQDIAFVADGSWHPPGYFIGKYGAVDLITGRMLVPPKYDDMQISGDNKYIIASNTNQTSFKKTYRVFTLSGEDITDKSDFVIVSTLSKGYYKILGCKTDLYGVADVNGKICVPTLYDEIGEKVLSESVIVKKGERWGVSSIDGSGKLLQPIVYQAAQCYSGDLYALKKRGSLMDQAYDEPVTIYYGDGSQVVSNPAYNRVAGVCGNVIYVNRKADDALIGLSKTGEVILEVVADGGVSGGVMEPYFAAASRVKPTNGLMIMNRWGEIIIPFDSGEVKDNSGKGITVTNPNTNKSTYLMADGYKLSVKEGCREVDFNNGWIFYKNTNGAWITDLMGNILIPKGIYSQLEPARVVAKGKKVENYVIAQNKEGKYGVLSLEATPYIYQPHEWAKQGIKVAILEGLVSVEQQRDWRDDCTRGDFCRIIAPLLEKVNKVKKTEIKFTDTQDPAIQLVASLGIVKGIGNGKFAPERPIERQQAAVILARVANIIGVEKNSSAPLFKDAKSIDNWAKEGVSLITSIEFGENNQRIMQGISGNRFAPKRCFTREESIITIQRMYQAYLKEVN